MIDLEKFIKKYYKALRDIVSALPTSAYVPEWLKNTSFVIGRSDIAGKVSLEIMSRENVKEIVWKGKTISPPTSHKIGFLISPNNQSIEKLIFPQDDKGTSVSITIGDKYFVMENLSFSNKEYHNKYWIDANFCRFNSGSIPFLVTSTGSMLGINLLWGFELEGQRQERIFEFIKIYGNTDMLSEGDQEIRDEAFRDFRIAVTRLGKKQVDWSFTDFLNDLQIPMDRNVLLLGSYKLNQEFEQLKVVLDELGYNAFLLMDSPDLSIQSNIEKLFAAIFCSCFVIVIDKEASGHIAELNTMLQFRFRPVIVLREQEQPATAFLEDSILTNDYFKVAIVDDISAPALLPHITWARDIFDRQKINFDTINYWRKQ